MANVPEFMNFLKSRSTGLKQKRPTGYVQENTQSEPPRFPLLLESLLLKL